MNQYVRLEYRESLESKRDLLLFQKNILELTERVKNYKRARKQELSLKNNMKLEFSNLGSKMTETLLHLPTDEQDFHAQIKKSKEEEREMSIEAQLREINQKLAMLQK